MNEFDYDNSFVDCEYDYDLDDYEQAQDIVHTCWHVSHLGYEYDQ